MSIAQHKRPIRDDRAAMKQKLGDVVLPFTEETAWSLLVSAFEGGSNYWYRIDNSRTVYARGLSNGSFEYLTLVPLVEGCSLIVQHDANEDGKYVDCPHPLNRARLIAGMQLMAEKWPHHCRDVLAENADADTGDVYLQCCVLGDLVYG
jgi:hypothetical protein